MHFLPTFCNCLLHHHQSSPPPLSLPASTASSSYYSGGRIRKLNRQERDRHLILNKRVLVCILHLSGSGCGPVMWPFHQMNPRPSGGHPASYPMGT
jgi:hypothetical protein